MSHSVDDQSPNAIDAATVADKCRSRPGDPPKSAADLAANPALRPGNRLLRSAQSRPYAYAGDGVGPRTVVYQNLCQ